MGVKSGKNILLKWIHPDCIIHQSTNGLSLPASSSIEAVILIDVPGVLFGPIQSALRCMEYGKIGQLIAHGLLKQTTRVPQDDGIIRLPEDIFLVEKFICDQAKRLVDFIYNCSLKVQIKAAYFCMDNNISNLKFLGTGSQQKDNIIFYPNQVLFHKVTERAINMIYNLPGGDGRLEGILCLKDLIGSREAEWRCLRHAYTLLCKKHINTVVYANDHDVTCGLLWLYACGNGTGETPICYKQLMKRTILCLHGQQIFQQSYNHQYTRQIALAYFVTLLLFGNDYCPYIFCGTDHQYDILANYTVDLVGKMKFDNFEKIFKMTNSSTCHRANCESNRREAIDMLIRLLMTFYINAAKWIMDDNAGYRKSVFNRWEADRPNFTGFRKFMLHRVIWYMWYVSTLGGDPDFGQSSVLTRVLASACTYDGAENAPIPDNTRTFARYKQMALYEMCEADLRDIVTSFLIPSG